MNDSNPVKMVATDHAAFHLYSDVILAHLENCDKTLMCTHVEGWLCRSRCFIERKFLASVPIRDSLARHAHTDLLIRCETSGRSKEFDIGRLEAMEQQYTDQSLAPSWTDREDSRVVVGELRTVKGVISFERLSVGTQGNPD